MLFVWAFFLVNRQFVLQVWGICIHGLHRNSKTFIWKNSLIDSITFLLVNVSVRADFLFPNPYSIFFLCSQLNFSTKWTLIATGNSLQCHSQCSAMPIVHVAICIPYRVIHFCFSCVRNTSAHKSEGQFAANFWVCSILIHPCNHSLSLHAHKWLFPLYSVRSFSWF